MTENNEQLTLISQQLAELIRLTRDAGRLVYTSEELAERLNTTEKKITEWRHAGALKGIFKGKAYIYPVDEVSRFLRDYTGKDISNKAETEASVAAVNRKKGGA